jgi:hypothetical protein
MLPLSIIREQIRCLRWKFEYADKPARYGAWDDSAPEESAKAWKQPREGLLFASIEAKDFNGVIHRVFECAGEDFCNFQWEVAAQLNVKGQPGRYRLVGLTLVSRYHRATLFHKGLTSVEKRDADDLDNHYLYGKV